MTIRLPAALEASIRQKVESGRFPDAGEVVRAAMRLLDEQEHRLDRGEGVLFTSEPAAQLRRDAEERFRRGERPDPDVGSSAAGRPLARPDQARRDRGGPYPARAVKPGRQLRP